MHLQVCAQPDRIVQNPKNERDKKRERKKERVDITCRLCVLLVLNGLSLVLAFVWIDMNKWMWVCLYEIMHTLIMPLLRNWSPQFISASSHMLTVYRQGTIRGVRTSITPKCYYMLASWHGVCWSTQQVIIYVFAIVDLIIFKSDHIAYEQKSAISVLKSRHWTPNGHTANGCRERLS